MLNRGKLESEWKKAFAVCPERMRPEASVIVPETMTGNRHPRSSQTSWMAYRAAFAFSVSKTVSTRRMSAPPSRSPFTATRYDSTSSRNVTARAAGSETSGLMLAVLDVGPMDPATKRRDGSTPAARSSRSFVSIARFATCALALAISYAKSESPYSRCPIGDAPKESVSMMSAPAERYSR